MPPARNSGGQPAPRLLLLQAAPQHTVVQQVQDLVRTNKILGFANRRLQRQLRNVEAKLEEAERRLRDAEFAVLPPSPSPPDAPRSASSHVENCPHVSVRAPPDGEASAALAQVLVETFIAVLADAVRLESPPPDDGASHGGADSGPAPRAAASEPALGQRPEAEPALGQSQPSEQLAGADHHEPGAAAPQLGDEVPAPPLRSVPAGMARAPAIDRPREPSSSPPPEATSSQVQVATPPPAADRRCAAIIRTKSSSRFGLPCRRALPCQHHGPGPAQGEPQDASAAAPLLSSLRDQAPALPSQVPSPADAASASSSSSEEEAPPLESPAEKKRRRKKAKKARLKAKAREPRPPSPPTIPDYLIQSRRRSLSSELDRVDRRLQARFYAQHGVASLDEFKARYGYHG